MPEPGYALVFPVIRDQLAVFVLPVGRDTFFGNLMHFRGPNLHLERLPARNNGSMQRLVHVRARHGNEVFDASGNGSPRIVNHAERSIAVLHAIGDEAKRQQVINLINGYALLFQLQMDRVEPLDARLGETRNPVLAHLLLNHSRHFGKKSFVLFSVLLDKVFQFFMRLRVEIAEGQILQFSADFPHAEPVGQRSIDLQSLSRDRLTPFRGEIRE